MNRLLFITVVAGLLLMGADGMAYEKRAYTVLEKDQNFEVRDYAPAVVAETIVQGNFEDVGSKGFRILVAYISGKNDKQESISMTAPVTQESEEKDKGEKIAMTAPVTQQSSNAGYRFTFMMPSNLSLETLPIPRDPRIRLRQEPAQRYATIQYSGFWSQKNYDRHLHQLQTWMKKRALSPSGEAVWARYDPPFMPWFWRTNEILIPINN